MKILFCKILSMKYYKGHCENDVPVNGGKYVYEHGYGHEEYNFTPIVIADEKDEKCFGFVEPKSNNGARNTFHIENIQGCEAMKNKPCV